MVLDGGTVEIDRHQDVFLVFAGGGVLNVVVNHQHRVVGGCNRVSDCFFEGSAGVYESHDLELGIRPKHTAAGSSSGKNAARTFVPKGLLDQ